MRDDASVLFGLTYFGIQFSPSKGWAPFLTGVLVLHSSFQTKQYIVTADFNGTNRFSCFLGLLGREHMVRKHGNRTASQLLKQWRIAISSK
jgi:hypothetical protein